MSSIQLRLLGRVQLTAREGGGDRDIALAPKPLAILAYVAVAGADGHPLRRDTLLALFWPELPAARARAALRQALFRLRHALGADALRTWRETAALAEGVLWCDVTGFERALRAGDHASAIALYGGELLDGFFVGGMSAELEEWIERERARLRREACRACWALAREAECAGDASGAKDWGHRAVALAPDDEIAIRSLIELLDRLGDISGALATGEEFARRTAEKFGFELSSETEALLDAVRARGVAPRRRGTAAVGAVAPEPPPIEAPGDVDGASRPTAAEIEPERAVHGSGPASGEPFGPAIVDRRRPWTGSPPRALAAAAAIVAVLGAGLLLAGRNRATGAPAGTDGAAAPPMTIASPVARRLYEEGVGRYYAGDSREAARLLRAALAEDSACAICAYRAAQASDFDDSAAAQLYRLAMRLSDRVSEAERLLIHYGWADVTNSPSRRAIADSLAARYPAWSEAQLAEAEALGMDGEWLAQAEYLRRAIAANPLPEYGSSARCPICSAQWALVQAYKAADSLPAAVRTARAWVHARPGSRVAWLELSYVLAQAGRYDEARAAMDASTRYPSDTDDEVIGHATLDIRAGNFAAADRLLRALAQTGSPNSRHDAFWWLVISLRNQGRFHEALAVAEGPMREAEASSTHGIGEARVAEAQVLLELGHDRRAAAIFAANASPAHTFFWEAAQGRVARQRVWSLTHAGSALAAAGDTTALAMLADSTQAWGTKSGFARDRRLYEYLRGLLWMARGRPEMAVAAYHRAMFSETGGFSRLDFELARALLALERPREAIPVLRHALGGDLEAGDFYITRTQLQELLAHAYDAAGEPDSAAVYYRCVVHAWRAADPPFWPRVARARARLALDHRRAIARRGSPHSPGRSPRPRTR